MIMAATLVPRLEPTAGCGTKGLPCTFFRGLLVTLKISDRQLQWLQFASFRPLSHRGLFLTIVMLRFCLFRYIPKGIVETVEKGMEGMGFAAFFSEKAEQVNGRAAVRSRNQTCFGPRSRLCRQPALRPTDPPTRPPLPQMMGLLVFVITAAIF